MDGVFLSAAVMVAGIAAAAGAHHYGVWKAGGVDRDLDRACGRAVANTLRLEATRARLRQIEGKTATRWAPDTESALVEAANERTLAAYLRAFNLCKRDAAT